ncbi:N-formylglutamate amidohydrolase [Sandarakinorhabdus oryzae]|uniref:N-formylglutamate amidohydrolase n=1 Tax=Sandarakinorhabdus oryzae TaxID=2675220 RepID=UPI0012E1D89C|nr:N-formylglutamate amidohydrolase [Sandarakinorhabdus oryzae]
MSLPEILPGTADLLLIADHASASVPPGIDLGIPPALLNDHIAVDIGTDALTRRLARALSAPAIIATVSRLVVDLNRDPADLGAVPASSDGHMIPGNWTIPADEREMRIAAIHTPYHDAIARQIAHARPALIIAVHSFTPCLATRPDEQRPWPVGILYNQDDRAARRGLVALASRGLHVGDNQPYSGRDLNYTCDRHAEAAHIPYLGIEVRNDGLQTKEGVARWTHILADCIATVRRGL